MYKSVTGITGSNKIIVPIEEYTKKLSKEEIEKIKVSKIHFFPDPFLKKSFADKLYITLLEANINFKLTEKNDNKEN